MNKLFSLGVELYGTGLFLMAKRSLSVKCIGVSRQFRHIRIKFISSKRYMRVLNADC